MKRYCFIEIFKFKKNGYLEALLPINVQGIVIGQGIEFKELGGIDFYAYKDYDIGAVKKKGILIIKGFYKKS